MSIFPFEKLTIHTDLTPEQIKEQLEQFVEPYQMFRNTFKQPNKPYNGKIQDTTFTLTRNINYRNSFLPVIKGKIMPNDYGKGSQINITISLNSFVIVFMAFWLFMVGSGGLVFLIFMISSGEFILGGLIPIGMFIFGCLLTIIPFKIEANIAKKFLQELWESY